MNIHQVGVIVLVMILTLLSGWGDAQGFLHASNIWQGEKLIWSEVMRSALGFILGIGMYWICIRFLQGFRIISPEIQTIGWFSITIIGLALLSGKFLHWQRVDQVVAIVALFCIAWLMIRTAG